MGGGQELAGTRQPAAAAERGPGAPRSSPDPRPACARVGAGAPRCPPGARPSPAAHPPPTAVAPAGRSCRGRGRARQLQPGQRARASSGAREQRMHTAPCSRRLPRNAVTGASSSPPAALPQAHTSTPCSRSVSASAMRPRGAANPASSTSALRPRIASSWSSSARRATSLRHTAASAGGGGGGGGGAAAARPGRWRWPHRQLLHRSTARGAPEGPQRQRALVQRHGKLGGHGGAWAACLRPLGDRQPQISPRQV